MSINVQCPSCAMRRRVNERLAGRTIRCPSCDQPLTIPELSASTPSHDRDEVVDEIEIVSDEVEAVAVAAMGVEAVEVAAVPAAPIAARFREGGTTSRAGASTVVIAARR